MVEEITWKVGGPEELWIHLSKRKRLAKDAMWCEAARPNINCHCDTVFGDTLGGVENSTLNIISHLDTSDGHNAAPGNVF